MNNSPVEDINFPERLKRITSEAHVNLEKLPISVSIVSPDVTKEQYAHYLNLMHDVVKDAEENIFGKLDGIIDNIPERKKSHLLEKDLEVLGYQKESYLTPISAELKNISIPFALGVMYVIEGSTLGGRFILKNINNTLGYLENEGASYFAGYGNTTGSQWKNFMSQLARYEAETKNDVEIIEGANFAFNAINRHFTANTPK